MRNYLLFFIALINFIQAKSQSSVILDSDIKKNFGTHLLYFLDSTNNLTLNEINIQEHRFKPVKTDEFYHGPSLETYWVKFSVKNASGKDYYLLIDNPLIKELELEVYSVEANKIVRLTKTGINHSFFSRGIKRTNFVFHPNLPKDIPITIYIKYISVRGELPIYIATPSELLNILQTKDLSWGIYFGIMLAIIIYNLFIYFTLKDRTYLLQIAFFLTNTMAVSILYGFSFKYLYPFQPNLNRLLNTVNAISSAFGIMFALDFLNIKKQSSRLYKVTILLIILFLAEAIINFADELIAAKTDSLLKLITSPIIIGSAIYIYKKGYTPARYYLIAATFLLIFIFINHLRLLGLAPSNTITEYGVFWGMSVAAILFSVALGDRYNIFKKEKERMQEELNKELELKMVERKNNQRQLEEVNKNLLQTNNELNSFIYTASHELKGPMMNIEGIMNILNMKEVEDKEFEELFGMITTSISIFKTTVDKLTEVSKIKQISDEKEEKIDVEYYIKEIIEEFKIALKNSDIEFHTDLHAHRFLIFSKMNFKRIMENLISNAINYRSTERKLKISITSDETSNYFMISVKDNGLGIKKDYQNKIFDMFKKGHSEKGGTGMGLYIVKQIIQNKGGKIELESQVDEGSTFKLFFKKSQQ